MISFQDMLQACKLEKVEEITGTEVQEGEVEPEGDSVGGPRRGGVKTFKYNYGIFSNTFYDFVSTSIWASNP